MCWKQPIPIKLNILLGLLVRIRRRIRLRLTGRLLSLRRRSCHLRRLVSDIAVLVQLVQKSLMRTVHFRLQVEGATGLGVVGRKVFIKSLVVRARKEEYVRKRGRIHLLSLQIQNLKCLRNLHALLQREVLRGRLRRLLIGISLRYDQSTSSNRYRQLVGTPERRLESRFRRDSRGIASHNASAVPGTFASARRSAGNTESSAP